MCGFQGQIDFDGWLLGSPKLIFSIQHPVAYRKIQSVRQHRISGLKIFFAGASSYDNSLQIQSWTFRMSNLLQSPWSPHVMSDCNWKSLPDRLLIIMHFAVIWTYKSHTYTIWIRAAYCTNVSRIVLICHKHKHPCMLPCMPMHISPLSTLTYMLAPISRMPVPTYVADMCAHVHLHTFIMYMQFMQYIESFQYECIVILIFGNIHTPYLHIVQCHNYAKLQIEAVANRLLAAALVEPASPEVQTWTMASSYGRVLSLKIRQSQGYKLHFLATHWPSISRLPS